MLTRIADWKQTDLEEAVIETLLESRLADVQMLAQRLYTLKVRATCAEVPHTPAQLGVVQEEAKKVIWRAVSRAIEPLRPTE